MDEARIRPRNPTIAGFLFSSFFYSSDDERSLLRSLCFQKLTRSHAAADTVGGGSQNWWRKGWNSVRRAGEWPGSVMDYAGSHRSRLKFKCLVRKFKADSKTVYSPRPSRFQYDPPSYELNFDHGHRREEDYQVQSSSLSAVKTGKSASSLNPRKSLKGGTQSLQVIGSSRP